MAYYQIKWKNSAKKELKSLAKEIIPKIIKTVESLAENPYPTGIKKMVGSNNTYRIRVGEYRIIYNIESNLLIIEIIKIGHRQGVYKKIN
jgi:mRNA interferase RelE/StbE